jgi:predicted DNA-binding transcriptional regulator AlpA
MTPTKPVLVRELAERLGITVDTFHRTRGRLHADDGLPAPLSRHRPFRWDRASIDAWFGRHHPQAPAQRPANDQGPLQAPAADSEWAPYLARVYGAN